MPRKSIVAIASLWFLGLTLDSSLIAQDSSLQTCETLCATPDAEWSSIPWELDLLKAQKKSVEKSKPIFIWSMDGHPLACT